MLFEMEQFDPADIARIGHGALNAGGTTFETSEACYLPMQPDDWARLKTHWQAASGGGAEVSRYWENRQSNFLYVYSRTQATLCVAGYFHSGYVGQFIDGAAQRFNIPARRPRQEAYFNAFRKSVGPQIRAWYPLLPSLIDFYDLYKNHTTAALIREHAPASGADLRVLEIGAGGCLLPLMLHRLGGFGLYQVIDLPFVIPLGFAMLRHFAPELAVALPTEPTPKHGVQFQTNDAPTIAANIAPGSLHAAVNVTSFGEMSEANVETYFTLLAQSLKPGGTFTCINRDAKTTNFADYPWGMLAGEVLVDAEDPISSYHREEWTIRRRVVRVG